MTDDHDQIQKVEHQDQYIEVPSNFHKYRWTAIAVWVALMTAAQVYAIAQNRTRIADIQQSRIQVRYDACRDQNERNRTTKAAVDRIIQSLPPDRQERAREGSKTTKLLIDALAPVRSCTAYANQGVR